MDYSLSPPSPLAVFRSNSQYRLLRRAIQLLCLVYVGSVAVEILGLMFGRGSPPAMLWLSVLVSSGLRVVAAVVLREVLELGVDVAETAIRRRSAS